MGKEFLYLGGRRIDIGADRLGSNLKGGRVILPYGEERSQTANGEIKFATYWRDVDTGLDYADQRYYSPGTGRFLTADPYRASGGAADPSSWNRYAYTRGDPINRSDPRGLQDQEGSQELEWCPALDVITTPAHCALASHQIAGVATYAETSPWDRTNEAIKKAVLELEITGDCAKKLGTLTVGGKTIDAKSIISAAHKASFINGSNSNDRVRVAIPGQGVAEGPVKMFIARDDIYALSNTSGKIYWQEGWEQGVTSSYVKAAVTQRV